MYLLPKIHKTLSIIQGRPVISNCVTPPEKIPGVLDHQLQQVTKRGKLYVKNTNHVLEKLKQLEKVPPNAISVVADVVVFIPACLMMRV